MNFESNVVLDFDVAELAIVEITLVLQVLRLLFLKLF